MGKSIKERNDRHEEGKLMGGPNNKYRRGIEGKKMDISQKEPKKTILDEKVNEQWIMYIEVRRTK